MDYIIHYEIIKMYFYIYLFSTRCRWLLIAHHHKDGIIVDYVFIG